MKFFTLFFFLLTILQTAMAVTFTSRIHSIDYGQAKEFHIVKFDNGRVGFIDYKNRDLIRAMDVGRKANLNIEIVLDAKYYIISAQSAGVSEEEEEGVQSLPPYIPTVLKDYNSALSVLNKMRRGYTDEGQCFNRAHVWAYEEFKRSRLNSMKLFLFFTNRYIRNYNFHWWFHVTPMTYVGNTMRTLDRRYAKGPALTKAWTDIFIKSKRTCRMIKTFARYHEYQQNEDCYLIPVSMYFIIPRDIERRDLMGIERDQFLEKDMDRAYRDAFAIGH
jgi:hypothetical protein